MLLPIMNFTLIGCYRHYVDSSPRENNLKKMKRYKQNRQIFLSEKRCVTHCLRAEVGGSANKLTRKNENTCMITVIFVSLPC
jgi:hypothetical protein